MVRPSTVAIVGDGNLNFRGIVVGKLGNQILR